LTARTSKIFRKHCSRAAASAAGGGAFGLLGTVGGGLSRKSRMLNPPLNRCKTMASPTPIGVDKSIGQKDKPFYMPLFCH